MYNYNEVIMKTSIIYIINVKEDLRNKLEAIKLKRTGALAGVLDLILIRPTNRKEFLRYVKRNGNSKDQVRSFFLVEKQNFSLCFSSICRLLN